MLFVPVLQPLEADGALEELVRQPLVAAHAADGGGGCSGGAGRHHGLDEIELEGYINRLNLALVG